MSYVERRQTDRLADDAHGQVLGGLREAGRHLHEFGSKAQELGNKVAETGKKLLEFAGIAEAVSFGGIAYLTHEAAGAIEKNAHLADQLGTTTEALLGMQYAAKEAGVGADEFGQSMRHLEKELGNPTREVSAALARLHLSTSGLLNQDASTQFKSIADGISRLGSQSEKAAVAAALFGREGVQLLSVLDEGSRGIDESTEKVRQLGASYSRVDAEKVIEANHALEDMKTAFDAIFTQLAPQIAPFITETAESILGLGKNGTSIADGLINGFEGVSRVMLRLLDVIDGVKGAFYGLGSLALEGASIGASFTASLDKAVGNALSVIGDKVGGSIGESLSNAGDFARRLGANVDQYEAQPLREYADRGFSVASEKFHAALDGQLSMTATAFLDKLISDSKSRAEAHVDEMHRRRAASATYEQWHHIGEVLAKGFNGGLARAGGLWHLANAKHGADLIGGWLHSGLAFMKTLPRRAFEAGWKPPIEVERIARGTFSGEAAGRMSTAYTIQEKQLEESKKQTQLLQQLYDEWEHGVVLP